MSLRSLAVVACLVVLASALPASAATTVTFTPSVAAYVGSCPATIKFTGVITGDPLKKVDYQFTEVVGGVKTTQPWASGTIPAIGKLAVVDTVVVPTMKAGIVTDTIRVNPGPAPVTATTSVTCSTSNPNATPTPRQTPPPTPKPTPQPTPKPTPKPGFNPALTSAASTHTLAKPAPTPTPNPRFVATNAQLVQPLPAPINLTDLGAVSNLGDKSSWQPVCTAHGGSGGSLACYIAVPAGKLVLLWDYPFSNPIDGFRVYPAGSSGSSGARTVQMAPMLNPVGTQSNSGIRLIVLDMPRAGACYTVTAFHGTAESSKGTQHCIGFNGIAKQVSLKPDKVGSMVEDWYYYVPTEVWKQSNEQPFVRDLLYTTVGYTHVASLFSDQSHSNVTQWTNSLYRGYLHFNTGAINYTTIAQAKLNLHADSGGMSCVAHWGDADHLWNPGDHLSIGHTWLGNSTIMGPDLSLDVTSIVQGWANAPGSNTGFALQPDQAEVIYQMIILSGSCLSNFPSASLDVTYY